MNDRFKVYKDPHFPANAILQGVKAKTFLDVGYVFAPYVPLVITPIMGSSRSKRLKKAGIKVVPKTILADEDFLPRKGILTRYGTKPVNASYYGTLTIVASE